MSQIVTIEEIKKIEASMLFMFDKICRDNNILYSICYGTLLGAVRHNGFIPWDDDIDIAMTRKEYNKLVDLISKGDPFKGRAKLIDLYSDKDFSAPLAKLVDTKTKLIQYDHAEKVVLGVYIDVFIFDKVPENEKKRFRLFKQQSFLQRVWTACEMKPVKGETNFIKKCIKKVLNKGFARLVAVIMDNNAKNSSKRNENSSLYGNLLYCVYGRERETFNSKQFTLYKNYKFENEKVMGFADYDLVLRKFYNDYMKLPPVEKRIPHHTFIAFWK